MHKPSFIPDTQNCTFNVVYSYDENGLIRAVGQIDGGDKFELEVQSKHKLSTDQIARKKEELQISNIE